MVLLVDALTLAFVLGPIVFMFVDISGAHLNPAVSLGFWILGDIGWKQTVAYIVIQLIASTLATLFMFLVFTNNVPNVPSIQDSIFIKPAWYSTKIKAVCMETFLTFCLVYGVLSMGRDKFPPIPELMTVACSPFGTNKNFFAPLGIGFLIAGLVLAGGETRSALNVCRVFGPGLVKPDLSFIWIYIVGGIAGSILASLFYKYVTATSGAIWSLKE